MSILTLLSFAAVAAEIMEALGYAAANFIAAHKQLYIPQKGNKTKKMIKLKISSEYCNGNILDVGGQLMTLYDRLCKIYPDDQLTESAAAVEEAMEALGDPLNATADSSRREGDHKVE